MHGIIHRSLKQYVIDKTDDDGWRTVADAAGVDTRLYLPVSEYPDEEITRIITTVSELTGYGEATIQRDFGSYFAPQMLETFDAMVDADWDAIDAIERLARVYRQVIDPDGDPDSVSISTRRPGQDAVVVHYRSTLRLCPLLEGIIRGIADVYDESVAIDKETPTREGLRHCELTVTRE